MVEDYADHRELMRLTLTEYDDTWQVDGVVFGEEALRESEERYRSILDNVEEGYFEVDLAGNFTFFNLALMPLLGERGRMSGIWLRLCRAVSCG